MVDFNPDAYLSDKTSPSGFNPDAYLAAKDPEWSDLPGNTLKGLKEAPQTALGMADQAIKGQDLTNPASYVNSAVQALRGTPLSETPTGQALGAVKEGVGHTIDTIKGIPDVMSHPWESAKRQIIEHPISSAVTAASIPLMGGAGSRALDTVGEYAGRFGESQAVKALGKVPPGMSTDAARELARRATQDYGLLDVKMGPIGRKETVDFMREQAGHDIGQIREDASANGPVMNGKQMADAIRERLKQAYSEGGENYDQVQALERELANIEAMPSTTPADFAQRATDINQKAKGKSFSLPTNVDTDVAGAMSGVNDDSITKALPDQAEQYGLLNQTFGDMKDLGNMIERGEKHALNYRNSHTLLESGQKFLDEIGAHKAGAKTGFAAESALKGAANAVRPTGVAGVTSAIMNALQTNPQSLGRYASALAQAGASGGPQGIAATHYILSLQHPDYNDMWNASDNQ